MAEIKSPKPNPNRINIHIFADSHKPSSGDSISGQGRFEGFVLGCGALLAVGGLLLGAYIVLINSHIIGP